MKRISLNKSLIALLMMSLVITPVSCIEVEKKEEVVITQQEQEKPYSFEDPNLEYLPAYFDDEQFKNFYDTCVERYEHGEPKAIYNMHELFLSRCITKEQIHMVLDDGYLTEFLDIYKSSNIIEKDYTLPKDVTIHETPELEEVIPEKSYEDSYLEYEDENETYVHNVTETASIESQKIMVDLMQDNVKDNAFILCPESSEDKRIFGQMLEISALRSEPLYIHFVDENDKALYSWTFSKLLYYNRDYLDLTVKYDGKSLNFDLQSTLPKTAKLRVYTGEPKGTTVLLKEHDGTIAYTLEVDEDGYIMLDKVYDKGSYNIACQYIQTETEDTTVDPNEKSKTKEFKAASQISNVGLLIVVVVLFVLGAVMMVLAVSSYQSSNRPKRKH